MVPGTISRKVIIKTSTSVSFILLGRLANTPLDEIDTIPFGHSYHSEVGIRRIHHPSPQPLHNYWSYTRLVLVAVGHFKFLYAPLQPGAQIGPPVWREGFVAPHTRVNSFWFLRPLISPSELGMSLVTMLSALVRENVGRKMAVVPARTSICKSRVRNQFLEQSKFGTLF
jgi:hypothetical protein